MEPSRLTAMSSRNWGLYIPHALVTTDSPSINRPQGRIADLTPNALTCIVKRLRRNGKDGV